MSIDRCRRCGDRKTPGDRHKLCWACRRGSSPRFTRATNGDGYRTHCMCTNPRQQFLRWFGGYQCERCGLRIIENPA